MKKTFTFLLFICLGTTLFAQQAWNSGGNKRENDAAYNSNWNRDRDNHYNDRSQEYTRLRMEEEITSINLHYDRKIRSINNDWFMNRFKKQRMIEAIECNRKEDISAVYTKFNDRRREYGYNEPGRH